MAAPNSCPCNDLLTFDATVASAADEVEVREAHAFLISSIELDHGAAIA